MFSSYAMLLGSKKAEQLSMAANIQTRYISYPSLKG